jgi:hypothetical protein
MVRVFQAGLAVWLAAGLITLSGCTPLPNPFKTQGSGAAQIGSAGGSLASGANASSPGEPDKDATINQAESQSLTDYLHSHHLPLVGGRVLTTPSGEKQVILYGYVAADFGKSDAAAKARKFLGDNDVLVFNRIAVSPDLAKAGTSNGSTSEEANLGGTDVGSASEYKNRSMNDPYTQFQAQQQQYQNQSPSMLSTLIPLLGMFSGSFGSGGFSGGFGTYGGGFGPYGGYPPYGGGYPPTYPPPGFGYPPPFP